MPSSASKIPTGEKSLPDTGPESRSPRTLFISENQRSEVLLTDYVRQLTTGGGKPGQGYPAILTSSAVDSPAKTSQSPADEQASSTVPDPPSSSSSHESPTLFSPMEAGSSLRTFPDFFPPTVDEISPSYSRRWPNSGFTTSPGECWTADTSECPSEGAVSSSLPDVLEADVPPRFFLSPRAAAGILRRAEKRGRELPPALAEALQALAFQHPDDGKRMTRTSSAEPSKADASTEGEAMTLTTRRSSPANSPDAPARDQTLRSTTERSSNSIRRLTPTECERLQGFPDTWTLPTGPTLAQTDPATQRVETP